MKQFTNLMYVLLIPALVVLAGCVTVPTGMVMSSGKNYDLKDSVLVLEPYVIVVNEIDARSIPKDSAKIFGNVNSFFDRNMPFPIKKCILDKAAYNRMSAWIFETVQMISDKKSINATIYDEQLLGLMEKNRVNYLMAVSLFCGTMKYKDTSFDFSYVYLVVFDMIDKNILFYQKDEGIDVNPRLKMLTDKQMDFIIDTFLKETRRI